MTAAPLPAGGFPAVTENVVHMATRSDSRRGNEPSGWATGGAIFAGSILTLAGIFQAITGLVAIINDNFFVVSKNYTFDLDVTAWGWIHLILGIILFIVGLGLFTGAGWAAVGAIAISMLSAIANFFFIPYYPVWSLVVIGLNIWVIWSLTRPGVLQD
jgi:hypothetical protein